MIRIIYTAIVAFAVLIGTTNAQAQELRPGGKVVIGGTGIEQYDLEGPTGPAYFAFFGTVGQPAAAYLELDSDEHYVGFWAPTFWNLTTVEEEIDDAQLIELTNYPNPFRTSTQIEFNLENPSNVTIKIYNTSGNLITTILNGRLGSGSQSFKWNGKTQSGLDVESGSYLYEVSVESIGGGIATRSLQARNIMVLVK